MRDIILPISMILINSMILQSNEYESLEQKNRLTEAIDYDLVAYKVMTDEQYFLAKNGLVWDDKFFKNVNYQKWPSTLTIYLDNLPLKFSAIKYKASKITIGSINIEMDDSAFHRELTPDEIKNIAKNMYGQDDDDILYHSSSK